MGDLLNSKLTSFFESLFQKMWEWIVGPFKDLPTFKNLIFGRDGDEDLAYGIFETKELTDIFGPGLQAFYVLAIFTILIGIILGGMKISSTGINPSNRTYVLDLFKDLIIVGLVLFNLDTLYYVLFGVNYSIVNLFASTQEELFEVKDHLDSGGVLGMLFISICLLGLSIWANFYYMMRKLTLLLLMIMGPFMVTLYLIPKTKGITMAWLKELTGTIFVQSIHAMLYWAIALLSVSTSGFVESVILYVIFIPVSEGIRALFGLGGDMTNRFTRAAALMGGSALAGMYGSVKGAFGGKSVLQALKDAKSKSSHNKNGEETENGKGLLNNFGTDISSTPKAERMLKSGDILSKAGKAIVGGVGSIAGSTMGPTGAMLGASLGYETGGVMGGVAGRAGALAAQGMEGILKKVNRGRKDALNAFKGVQNAESEAAESIAKGIAEDETTRWASQNQEQFLKNLKERFPDASDSQLANMWGNELNAKRQENLEKARKQVGQIISAKNPHAKAEDLVNPTVDSLTNEWAKNNKEAFMAEYAQKNPLPFNASEETIANYKKNMENAWKSTVAEKKNALQQVASNVIGTLTKGSDSPGSLVSKEQFAELMSNKVAPKMNMSNSQVGSIIQKAIDPVSFNGTQHAKTSSLVNTTVDKLTSSWAKDNKEQFFSNYDQNNPLPQNASATTIQQHNQNRALAWQNAVDSKRQEISNAVSQVANKLSYNAPEPISFVNKDAFVNEVGNNISGIIGKGARESVQAVKQATSGVQSTSLYHGKTVNREMLLSRLADQKTQSGMAQFINDGISAGKFKTQEEGMKQWREVEAPKRFAKNVYELDSTLPKAISLDHQVIQNPILRNVGAAALGASKFVTSASGIEDISKFVGETRIGQAGKMGLTAALTELSKPIDYSQGALSGIQEKGKAFAREGASQFVTGYKNHTPVNAVGKQAAFRNIVAYTTGVVGGVNAYKHGARLGMKLNPYNKAVNDQIAEIADIKHMVQTVTDGTGTFIPNGAIRMVTTANQTVLQVRDKTGQIQTVSRITAGDANLKKGETLYQDLTIDNGNLVSASPVYKEDSGGGHIMLNRRINVDPNRLVANRNTIQTPRMVNEIQSYSQAVDSGQYYLKDAVKDMSNIQMVVDRNRSYLVGQKDGREYRISQYGPGDARLNPNEIIYRTCNVKNSQIEVIKTLKKVNDHIFDYDDYTSSLTPSDLIPKVPPNKRNLARKQYDKYRTTNITEPLKW